MINVTYMRREDVEAIVKLRDESKLGWAEISHQMGYCKASCSKHYYIHKSPEPKCYFSDIVAAIKKLDMSTMSTTDAYNMAKAMGYQASLFTFRERKEIKHLPLKHSTARKQMIVDKVMTEAAKDPSQSLRDLVWKHSEGYGYNFKLNLLRQLPEIKYNE
ncbi:hypothetical protein pVco7_gp078 [Vibrio phage pVco-7]|uniref:Uncharacterized protein n=1 Tax=Vibrio phage pVco-5 TaxID=1965485 RepID=A0A1W6JUZ0_9CAUD|nr:hypothetical protein KNT61_gp079 [Vibrio phage pVco-5]ARM71067.1 hypothetical protein pVco5_078 [Vibrio phage pVco-5]